MFQENVPNYNLFLKKCIHLLAEYLTELESAEIWSVSDSDQKMFILVTFWKKGLRRFGRRLERPKVYILSRKRVFQGKLQLKRLGRTACSDV